jgi:hypothetical protein
VVVKDCEQHLAMMMMLLENELISDDVRDELEVLNHIDNVQAVCHDHLSNEVTKKKQKPKIQ